MRRLQGIIALLILLVFAAGCTTPGEERDSDAERQHLSTPTLRPSPTPRSARGPPRAAPGWRSSRTWPTSSTRSTRTSRVKWTVRDFAAYPAQVKLALNSDDGPDVCIGNLGWALDGPLIKAGLLRPLDDYAEAYGWDTRYPEVGLRQLKFSEDGTSLR